MGDRTEVSTFEVDVAHIDALLAAGATPNEAGPAFEAELSAMNAFVQQASKSGRHGHAPTVLQVPIPTALRRYRWERYLCAGDVDTFPNVVAMLTHDPLRGTAAEQGLAEELTERWLWDCALNVGFRLNNPNALTDGKIEPGSVLWVPYARAAVTELEVAVGPVTPWSAPAWATTHLAAAIGASTPKLLYEARDFVRRYGGGAISQGGWFNQIPDRNNPSQSITYHLVRSIALRRLRFVVVAFNALANIAGVTRAAVDPATGKPWPSDRGQLKVGKSGEDTVLYDSATNRYSLVKKEKNKTTVVPCESVPANFTPPTTIGIQVGRPLNHHDPMEIYRRADQADFTVDFQGGSVTGKVTELPGVNIACLDTSQAMLGAVYDGVYMGGGLNIPSGAEVSLVGPTEVFVNADELAHADGKKPIRGYLEARPEATERLAVQPTDIGYVLPDRDLVLKSEGRTPEVSVKIHSDLDPHAAVPLLIGEDAQGRVRRHGATYDELIPALDSELIKGHPVIVGVSFWLGLGASAPQNDPDRTTHEHYVVIVAKGSDDFGEYYAFYDPQMTDGNNVQKQRLRPKAQFSELVDAPARDNRWIAGSDMVLGTLRTAEKVGSYVYEVWAYRRNWSEMNARWSRPPSDPAHRAFGSRALGPKVTY